MKGDLSRYTFDPKKHYSQVVMQQGRVQVDADWNEQQAIHQHRVETEARDVIGPCGVPVDAPGFGIGILQSPQLAGISFIDDRYGWVVGTNGGTALILATADGSKTWRPQNTGLVGEAWLTSTKFVSRQVGWAVGYSGPSTDPNSLILATTNGGETWQRQTSDHPAILSDVTFIDELRGWVVGYLPSSNASSNEHPIILATIDGGKTWQRQASSRTGNTEVLRGVTFIDQQYGWAVGYSGSMEPPANLILATTDGGATWTPQTLGNNAGMLYGVTFIDQFKGWIAATDGILATTDGGQRWVSLFQSLSTVNVCNIFFVDQNYGWAVTDNGSVLATSNGGQSWAENSLSTSIALYDVAFTNDRKIGWAVGSNAIFRKTDLSADWQNQITVGDLTISPGRIYVDGILCETEGAFYTQQPDFPIADSDRGYLTTQGYYLAYLDVWQHHLTHLDDAFMREVALGGPDTTTRLKTLAQVKLLPLIGKDFTCSASFPVWDQLISSTTGTLNVRTRPSEDPNNPCELPPTAGYQRLENQLYRVEIHQGGRRGRATFKWSRDNGSVVTLIEAINGREITVQSVGPDDVLGFANGQWVELLDDRHELRNQPGEIRQIDSVNAATRIITLTTAPSLAFDPAFHPKLRRWDSVGTPTVEIPTTNDGWIPLEGAIEVHFSAGTYKTGDYWLIPARTETGEVEWPPYEVPNTSPIAQPPLGIHHHYCRLAIIQVTQDGITVLEDCRRFFGTLRGDATAMHVVDINWTHDNDCEIDTFEKNGLTITLDAQPETASVTQATMIVTLDYPFGIQPDQAADLSLILDGTFSFTFSPSPQIIWQPANNQARTLITTNPDWANHRFLLRVTLKGHKIWTKVGDRKYYLDGQAFGDPSRPRGLVLPSGDGQRASDFESWFYLSSSS